LSASLMPAAVLLGSCLLFPQQSSADWEQCTGQAAWSRQWWRSRIL